MKRKLGRSGIEISAMGLGCWAVGGEFFREGKALGWGKVDDAESIRAIQTGIDLGITFFDTANVYGCGHSENILAKAIEGKRDSLVIATKFGHTFDEGLKEVLTQCADSDYIRQCCENSLRRLRTDRIDLYQLHLSKWPVEDAGQVLDVLEELVAAGKIRYYGWSTDETDRAEFFAQGKHCTAIQQRLNILDGNLETLRVCEKNYLASINRGPLAMGILTGKFNENSIISDNDIRSSWNFKKGDESVQLKQLDTIRQILTSRGRTLAQGALAWLWAKSENTIPIPGFKTVAQVKENIGAMEFGPLTEEQMKEIDTLMKNVT